MLKILGIITHNDLGGAQNAIHKLANQVNKGQNEFQVIYLYSFKNGNYISHPNSLCLVEENVSKLKRYPLIIFRLFKYLKKNRDASILSFLPLSNFLSAVIGRIVGIRNITISHRNPVSSYNLILRVADYICGSIGIYGKIVCNSQSVLDSVAKYPNKYKAKCTVIYNAYQKISCNENRKHSLPFNSKSINVIAVGRLSKQKNFEFLVSVFENLPNFNLFILGEGELKEKLQRQICDANLNNVLLLGALPASVVNCALRECDIFIQPSLYEGQSNALIEAISNSCYIVSSDIPSQREVLTTNEGKLAGDLIKGYDKENWIKHLKSLDKEVISNSPKKKIALQRSKDFSVEIMAESFLKTFSNI